MRRRQAPPSPHTNPYTNPALPQALPEHQACPEALMTSPGFLCPQEAARSGHVGRNWEVQGFPVWGPPSPPCRGRQPLSCSLPRHVLGEGRARGAECGHQLSPICPWGWGSGGLGWGLCGEEEPSLLSHAFPISPAESLYPGLIPKPGRPVASWSSRFLKPLRVLVGDSQQEAGRAGLSPFPDVASCLLHPGAQRDVDCPEAGPEVAGVERPSCWC